MLESQAAPAGAPEAAGASSAADNAAIDPAIDRIAQLKARRAAAAAGTAPAPPKNELPASAAPPAQKKTEAEVDLTDAELKQFTTLSRESRKDKARIKELEVAAADAAKLREYRRLKSEGKFEEAATLIEFDVDATVAKRLAGTVQLTPEQQQIADLKKKVDDVTATTEDQKKRDADLAAANTAAAKEKNSQTVIAFVAEKKTEFPFLSRNPAWVATAYDQALDAYGTLAKEGKSPKTNAEREAFVRAFLDEAEAEHADTAKLYGAPATNQLADRSQARNPPAANGNRREQQQQTNQTKKLTFEEVRYRRRR